MAVWSFSYLKSPLMGTIYAATFFFLSYTGFKLTTNASEDNLSFALVDVGAIPLHSVSDTLPPQTLHKWETRR